MINKITYYLKSTLKGSFIDHLRVLILAQKDKDKEIDVLNILCDKKKGSIDIGAAVGFYTHYILKHSSFCYCFEVNPERAKRLKKIFSSNKVKVETIALSNKKSSTLLKTPIKDGIPSMGRASVESENLFHGQQTETLEVFTNMLDNFSLKNIGFIKIDVEGHELAVLEGGKNLLLKNSPNILVEAEERHKKNAVKKINNFLSEFGYKGIFLFNNKFIDLDLFNAELHQRVSASSDKANYANNFIFSKNAQIIKMIKNLRF
tara:strand:- start:21287 stop:22069 length:783 start_codon:yes stop_codon:yes gene_type:complete